MTMKTTHVRMPLRFASQLYECVKWHAERGRSGSFNDLIVTAVAVNVRSLEREAIDDAFRGMADDNEYHLEALRIVEEFGG
jgi:hypothetical protein